MFECTLYVCAAAGPVLTDLCRPMYGTVRFLSAQHVTRGGGCLWQVAVGGMIAAHWPFAAKSEK